MITLCTDIGTVGPVIVGLGALFLAHWVHKNTLKSTNANNLYKYRCEQLVKLTNFSMSYSRFFSGTIMRVWYKYSYNKFKLSSTGQQLFNKHSWPKTSFDQTSSVGTLHLKGEDKEQYDIFKGGGGGGFSDFDDIKSREEHVTNFRELEYSVAQLVSVDFKSKSIDFSISYEDCRVNVENLKNIHDVVVREATVLTHKTRERRKSLEK